MRSRWHPAFLLLVFAVLASCQDQNSYSDTTGRSIFDLGWYMAATNPEVCIPKYYPTYKCLAVIRAPAVGMFTTAQVSIIVSETNKKVLVFFRGAKSVSSFISGAITAFANNFASKDWQFGTKVGVDYTTAFDGLWDAGLRSAINSAWTDYCDFRLVIGGHSVGSCLAQMLSLYVIKTGMWPANLVELYSYGAPRCGNQNFALSIDANVPTRYRINNNLDIVPNLPYTTCSRSSVPTLATAQDCYWHCCYAIKYSKSIFGAVSISRCAAAESTTCTGALLDLNPLDNAGFFNRTVLAQYDTFTC